MSFQACAVDAYAEHLSSVNKRQPVLASEDIYSSKGLLLIRKGEAISPSAVERMISSKLCKPLDQCVQISNPLTLRRIEEDLQQLLTDPTSRRLHSHYAIGAVLERADGLLASFPVLQQKLTVLALQLPRCYRQGLIVAWGAAIVGCNLGLSDGERDELFVAALVRDLGLLHIDQAIVSKRGAFTPLEWRTMCSHVLIGKLILKQMNGMPGAVVRAVAEHHEMCDGTGYVAGLTFEQLGLPGQIISVADAMTSVLLRLKARGRGPRDLLPILRINSHVHHPEVCAELILLLRELGLPEDPATADGEIDALVSSVLEERSFLQRYAGLMGTAVEKLPGESGHRAVKASRLVYRLLNDALLRSGVLEEGYVDWLKGVGASKQRAFCREVEDTQLMLEEVRWQLQKLTRLLHEAVRDAKVFVHAARVELEAFLRDLPALDSGELTGQMAELSAIESTPAAHPDLGVEHDCC